MPRTIPTTVDGVASGRLTIDLEAIRANYAELARLTGAADTGAVVKADAYGLGLDAVAPTLWAAGARRFYVAQIEEAVRLRGLLAGAEITVMAPTLPASFAPAREHRLTVALNGPADLAHWREDIGSGAPPPAQVHIDTGMTRLGFHDGDADALWASLDDAEAFGLTEVSSHLASADQPESPANRSQLQRFNRAVRNAPTGIRQSLANSSGIFLGPDFHFTGVRPGMALYGLNPTPDQPNPMRPAIRLDLRVLQVRRLEQAETVGYAGTATAPKGARIATIAAGYADGLHRTLHQTGGVFFGGKRAPIIGRISMDLITVDVTHIAESAVGDFAEAIGPNQSADALAAAAGTIGYEILTSLGGRYARDYVGAAS